LTIAKPKPLNCIQFVIFPNRKSVDAFIQSGLAHAKLDHLQLIELNSVRPLLPHTMDRILELEKANADVRRISTQRGTPGDRSFIGNTTY
jgi:hypothetical protein